MSLEALTELVSNELEQLKQVVTDNINDNIGLAADLSHHIFKSGGKRVRPLLLLLVAKACGYQGYDHIMPAAAIEYFHTATLLHDDVLDESQLRRGQSTANEIFGAKASILVGDILLTQSMQFMAKTGNMPMLKVLIDAAHEITCGEVKQLQHAQVSTLTTEEYFDVIRAKTALLFSAAAEIGAMAANSDDVTVKAMKDFGLHLGNAFQIIDDLLDYQADQDTFGKAPGDDMKDGKLTLPMIHAMHNADQETAQFLKDCIVSGSAERLDQIVTIMKNTGAFEKTLQTAKLEADAALTVLQVLPNNEARIALETLVNYTLARCY